MVVSVNEMLPLHRFEVVVTSVEDVNDSESLSFSYDLIGKLFEDAIVTLCVGIRKSTLGSVLTKSKVIPKVQPGSGTGAGFYAGFPGTGLLVFCCGRGIFAQYISELLLCVYLKPY